MKNLAVLLGLLLVLGHRQLKGFKDRVGRVELQDAARLHGGHFRAHPLEILLHLKAHALLRLHTHRMAAQLGAQAYLLDRFAQRLLDKVQGGLGGLGLLLDVLLLVVAAQAEVARGDVLEVVPVVLPEGLGNELIHVLGEQENVVALVLEQVHLGQAVEAVPALAGGEVDLLLPLGHGVRILAQGDQLVLTARPEEHEVLQRVLMRPVARGQAVFELAAKGGEEFLVLLPVVLLQLFQLGFDALLEVLGDELELAVVLEQLAGDVEAEVLGVHHALDKTEVLGEQIGAVFHNHHAGGIELKAALKVLGIIIVRGAGGNV